MKDEQFSIIIITILNLSSENISSFLSPVSHNDSLTVFSSNLFSVIRSLGLISINPRSVSPTSVWNGVNPDYWERHHSRIGAGEETAACSQCWKCCRPSHESPLWSSSAWCCSPLQDDKVTSNTGVSARTRAHARSPHTDRSPPVGFVG